MAAVKSSAQRGGERVKSRWVEDGMDHQSVSFLDNKTLLPQRTYTAFLIPFRVVRG